MRKSFKKNEVIIVLVICVVIGVTHIDQLYSQTAYAEATTEAESPTRYTYFSTPRTSFGISGNTASWTLRANKLVSYDQTYVTAILYGNSGATMSSTTVFYNSNISVNKSVSLTSYGRYYVKFTVKCYKNGVLQETFTLTTASDTY